MEDVKLFVSRILKDWDYIQPSFTKYLEEQITIRDKVSENIGYNNAILDVATLSEIQKG